MTNAEIFRGRYLDSFERPAALTAGAVREYKFSLHDVDHVFKAGHTVMVEIQSTWFPLYDRNPQTLCGEHHDRKAERLPAGDDYDLFRRWTRLRIASAGDERLQCAASVIE